MESREMLRLIVALTRGNEFTLEKFYETYPDNEQTHSALKKLADEKLIFLIESSNKLYDIDVSRQTIDMFNEQRPGPVHPF